MKVKIEDTKKIKEFIKEQKELCKKYNIYPMHEIDITTGIGIHSYYELDKMSPEERMGTFK